ncbi:MAG: YraN family protein [Burkholderiaceae bacterium]|nr:YraN family protein [Burkholderiaceae bacterium]
MTRRSPMQARGDAAEERALAFLVDQGLSLVERNVASRLGEIDLVMRDDAAFVFVEVRSRAGNAFGGAAASVGVAKRRRLQREAQRWMNQRFGDRWPPCRFDVCAFDGARLEWIRGAF